MSGRIVLAVAAALLMFAPVAEAATKPVAYFLKDAPGAVPVPDPGPTPVPVPIGVPHLILAGEGILEPYDPTIGNFPNGTRPHMRAVPPATEVVNPLEFVTPADHSHPDRIKGLILVGLYPGQSAVVHGNLTATLYEVPASGAPVALVNASVSMDFNASKLPNATSLMPPNSTDPMVILYYELGQVLPVVLQPPAYFLIGPVDINITNGSRLALDIRLAPGSSPAPAPIGASATMQYESLYTPSYVFIPWYTVDLPKPVTSDTQTVTLGPDGRPLASSPASGSDDGGSDGGTKGTPGAGLALVAAALAAAAFVARRRLS